MKKHHIMFPYLWGSSNTLIFATQDKARVGIVFHVFPLNKMFDMKHGSILTIYHFQESNLNDINLKMKWKPMNTEKAHS